MSERMLRDLRAGKRHPSRKTVLAIAEALGQARSRGRSRSRSGSGPKSSTSQSIIARTLGYVVLTPGLGSLLLDLLAERRRESLSRGWPEVPEWIIPAEPGVPLDENNFERTWRRLHRRARKAGVRPLKLHCTRHTWASLALASGKSVRWVADQLGHASPMLTLKTYAHSMQDEETDLSFADFGSALAPKRPYTAPLSSDHADSENAPDLTGRERSLDLEHETGLAGACREAARAMR